MLKIKDSVDLKELEKFGYIENKPFNYLKFFVDTPVRCDLISIDIKTRRVERVIKEIYSKEVKPKKVCEKYIIDLIDAGLIEKDGNI